MKPIWEIKRLLLPKRRIMQWNSKGKFSKITETALWEPPWKAAYSIAIHSISIAGYHVTAILAFIRSELCAREASSFWFLKNGLLQFHCILHLFNSWQTFVFLLCSVRSTIANLCPRMSYFHVLDFSECRSEEVMFLLILSVVRGIKMDMMSRVIWHWICHYRCQCISHF